MNQKPIFWIFGALVVGGALGYLVRSPSLKPSEPTSASATPASQATKPSEGYALHIDAEQHFPGNEKTIAHHYCKQVRGDIFECQLYDADTPNARLVGVEVVVPTAQWQSFSPTEQAVWHYHKEEIPKVNAKLPDLSEAEAAEVAKSLEETYGKIYLLWNPTVNTEPLGNPSVTVL